MTTPDSQSILADLYGMLQRFKPEGVAMSEETSLATDLSIDSVEVLDLIMEIEDKYSIDIPINSLADVERVRDLAKIICDRINGTK